MQQYRINITTTPSQWLFNLTFLSQWIQLFFSWISDFFPLNLVQQLRETIHIIILVFVTMKYSDSLFWYRPTSNYTDKYVLHPFNNIYIIVEWFLIIFLLHRCYYINEIIFISYFSIFRFLPMKSVYNAFFFLHIFWRPVHVFMFSAILVYWAIYITQ